MVKEHFNLRYKRYSYLPNGKYSSASFWMRLSSSICFSRSRRRRSYSIGIKNGMKHTFLSAICCSKVMVNCGSRVTLISRARSLVNACDILSTVTNYWCEPCDYGRGCEQSNLGWFPLTWWNPTLRKTGTRERVAMTGDLSCVVESSTTASRHFPVHNRSTVIS